MLVLANPVIFLLASRSVVFKLNIFSPKEIKGGTERVRRKRPLKHNFSLRNKLVFYDYLHRFAFLFADFSL